jgi:hypothetical protein
MAREEQEKLLNEQYSNLNDQKARMFGVLSDVIEYVAGLSGFKSKFPGSAAQFAAAKEAMAAEEEAVAVLRTEWSFRIGEWVAEGEEIVHKGKVYVVLQGHTLQEDWEPGLVPALYRLKGDEPSGDDPVDEWPEFVQPTGAHDAYAKGAKISYKGEHYISLIDANVYSPDDYPAGWQKQ